MAEFTVSSLPFTTHLATPVIFMFGACAASIALSQDYPSRPLRIIVPFPAGGTPGEFADFMRAELVKMGEIAKESGAHVESRFC